MVPETKYAKSGNLHIAYQVIGGGSLDLVFVHGWISHIEHLWEEPSIARFLRGLASFSRLILLDKRGTGISDPVPLAEPTSLDAWMDDARVAADAAGVGPMVVLGDLEGGPMAMVFAATYPDRVSALVLVNTYARLLRAADYPIGLPPRVAGSVVAGFERTWGTGEAMLMTAPGAADDLRFRRWQGRYERLAMPRRAARIMFEWAQRFDVRAVLPSIQAPTLVVQRQANRYYRAAYGRYLAKMIPGASYVELPGTDAYPFFVNAGDVLDEVETFVTGSRPPVLSDRRLATVLFTDIVDSTGHAARLGDQVWRDLLHSHHALVRQQLLRFGGQEVDTTGDGFLVVFDGPTRAVLCALAIVSAAPELGIEIRAGVHTGEIELVGPNVAGIAVHIAARVLATAGPRTVMTTSTVRDLAVGSPIAFIDRGVCELRGVPGQWQLWQAEAAG